jgi:hypothetical protein
MYFGMKNILKINCNHVSKNKQRLKKKKRKRKSAKRKLKRNSEK